MKLALCALVVALLCACNSNVEDPRAGCLKGHDEAVSGNWGATVLFVCDAWRPSKAQSASGDTK